MKEAPKRKRKRWNTKLIHFSIRKKCKERLGKKIKTSDINKIWNTYIEEEILSNLKNNTIIKMNKSLTMWVKATPLSEHKGAMSLLSKGLIYKSGGMIKEANIKISSSDFIYKIMVESNSRKGDYKLYFKPHKNLSKAVHEGINSGKLITRLQCQ